MVGEFPELQGIMGGYYARAEGLDLVIADAIRDHYKPQGPSDAVPNAPVSLAVALADKLDTLVGFFAIDEKPTGSRDPFALRRAALGIIRIILENGVRIELRKMISSLVADAFAESFFRRYDSGHMTRRFASTAGLSRSVIERWTDRLHDWPQNEMALEDNAAVEVETRNRDLLAFFADRLKVLLRDQGKRHDLVDAVFALGDDDLVRIVARVEALDGFLTTDNGANLLAGYRRATNILKAEEKKGPLPQGAAQALPGAPEQETALLSAITSIAPEVDFALAKEDCAGAMRALSALRGPVDAFFDKVLVNSDKDAERENRLRLLGQVRDAMGRLADFSLISG